MTELEKQTFDKAYALIEKNKQIEEMAKAMCEYYYEGTCYQDKKPCDCKCDSFTDAQYLYAKGYRKASDVAREIFEEILNEIDKAIDFTADSRRIRFELCQQKDIEPYKDRFFNVCDGKYNCVLGFGKYIAELKKKYTEET